jgi:hypothetical protein
VLTATTIDLVCSPSPSLTSSGARESARPTGWRGSGASLTMYSETGPLGEWHSDGHPCPCRCNAHIPSRLPWVILSLPGATPYNPFAAHSQMGLPLLHRISASFGILLASYWIPHNHYAPRRRSLKEQKVTAFSSRTMRFSGLVQGVDTLGRRWSVYQEAENQGWPVPLSRRTMPVRGTRQESRKR